MSIFMRFPGGRSKALTLSYDDGVEQDAKLVEILNRHGLKCTFNLNSGLYAAEGTVYPKGQIHRRMTEKQITKTFLNSGHEVAVHALTHPFLEQLPSHLVAAEILKDRENLERQFNAIVRGMAYPFGTFSDSVVDVLRDCGIAYSRTVISTLDFRIPTDWLRLAATCHHNAPEFKSLAKKFVEEKATHTPWLFYLWGHSYEFEADNNWNIIEEFAQYAGKREDIWYATNIEVYEYIEDYNRLIFSADGQRVKNPACRKIWLEVSGKMTVVEAGAVLKLSES